MLENIRMYIEALEKEAIPQLSVNCVIIGFYEGELKVVVNRISADKRSLLLLPGGYVGQTENLADAVKRVVRESTGLEEILLKQFGVFGNATRSFAGDIAELISSDMELDSSVVHWLSSRFISLCYMALVDYRTIHLKPTQFFTAVQWLPLNLMENLAMDHADIIRSAREFLVKEMPYAPVASNLLPSRFTLPELQGLIETILGRRIDRPNFRRTILRTGMVEKVGVDHSRKRRPADLYRFKYGKNTPLMDELKFGF